jgi:hypothetical protein
VYAKPSAQGSIVSSGATRFYNQDVKFLPGVLTGQQMDEDIIMKDTYSKVNNQQ